MFFGRRIFIDLTAEHEENKNYITNNCTNLKKLK